jgi:hypothetical protein
MAGRRDAVLIDRLFVAVVLLTMVAPVAGSTDSLLRVPAAEGSTPGWQR